MSVGSTIAGRFALEGESGRGGMGAVYRAVDRDSGGLVAVKLLDRSGRADDRERFEREARALERVEHPAIVRYVAHGVEADGTPWIAMQWIAGEPLRDRLHRGPLSAAEARSLGRRLAGALSAVHRAGIVHRDVKPENVLLPQGRIDEGVVVDFGVARTGGASLTRAGMIVGTPGYMAPEQARGGAVDARTDLFALGCVLWECLAGRPLFPGSDPLAVLMRVLLDDAPPLSRVVGGVPADLEGMVARLLEKDAADRPAHAEAILEALDADGPSELAAPPRVTTGRGLGGGEQRLCAVVLARAPDDPGPTGRTVWVPTTGEGSDLRSSLDEMVRGHGGRLERLVDGSFCAAFRDNPSATDLATRSAAAAMKLGERLGGWSIAVTIGRGAGAGVVPFGEVVDRAVALPIEPGTIRLDPVTADLLDTRFELSREGGVVRLAGEARTPDPERLVLGKSTPFVGRERELSMLLGLVSESAAEEASRIVVVTGPAGAGKSRLRREIVARLPEGTETWLVRGDAFRQAVPLAPIGTMLQTTFGLAREPDRDARRARLRERVAALLPEAEQGRVAVFLGELAGVPFDDADAPELRAARLDPGLWSAQLARALATWMQGELYAGPRLLVLEDLHWFDASSVRILERVIDELSAGPIVVLGLGRPEAERHFPALFQKAHARLSLGPLSRKASERLVRALVDAGGGVVERLIEWGEGSPLLLEELARAASASTDLPGGGTVGTMIQARLEARPAEDRRVLRAASVFGRTFWTAGVARLCGAEPDAALRAQLSRFVQDDLVVVRPEARLAGEEEHVFRHDLLRDAAYALLTEEDRVLGHRLAAEWLEEHVEVRPAELVEHLERAGEHARAALAHLDASRRALVGDDLLSAAAHATRGRELVHEGETRGRLAAMLAEARLWQGSFVEAWELSGEALDGLSVGDDDWCHAARQRAVAATRIGRVDSLPALVALVRQLWPPASVAAAVTLARVAERAASFMAGGGTAELLARLDDPRMAALAEAEPSVGEWVAMANGAREMRQGRYEPAREAFSVAHERARRTGNTRAQLECRAQLMWASRSLGDRVAFSEHSETALALAEQLGALGMVPFLRICRAVALSWAGRHEEAEEAAARAVAESELMADERLNGLIRLEHAQLTFRRGEIDLAAEAVERTVVALSSFPERGLPLAALARLEIARGRRERGLAIAEDAQRWLDGLEIEDELVVRRAHVEALFAAGRREDAQGALAAALARFDEVAGRLRTAEARERMRQGIPVVRDLFSLAGR